MNVSAAAHPRGKSAGLDQARRDRRACFLYGNVAFEGWLWYTSRSVARRDARSPQVWELGLQA